MFYFTCIDVNKTQCSLRDINNTTQHNKMKISKRVRFLIELTSNCLFLNNAMLWPPPFKIHSAVPCLARVCLIVVNHPTNITKYFRF